jgi:GNAT superfamily N-acetyltransferase
VLGLPDVRGPERVRIPDTHHAADPPRSRLAYRALYREAAAVLVGFGRFDQRILVLSEPPGLVPVFAELGFGIDQIKGVRPVSDELPSYQPSLVEPARPEEIEDLLGLWIELVAFHARPPMLDPALVSVAAVRSDLKEILADAHRVLLVARESGRAVGMIEAHPDSRYQETLTIGLNVVTESARSAGVGTAMLDAVLRWGKDQGYRHCAVGWASANPVSDAFYRSRGFVPVRAELVRRIDPRVAWANERVDYAAYGPLPSAGRSE